MAKRITAKKSCSNGMVCVVVSVASRGYAGPTIKVESRLDIATAEARALAAALVALADEADAKVARRAEAEARRQKWRDREVAAGRRVVMRL